MLPILQSPTKMHTHKCNNMLDRRWHNTSKSLPTVMDESRHPKASRGVPQHWQRETEMGIFCVCERESDCKRRRRMIFVHVCEYKKDSVCSHECMCTRARVQICGCWWLLPSEVERRVTVIERFTGGEREMTGGRRAVRRTSYCRRWLMTWGKKGRGEKDIIRRGRGKAREGSWLKEREIPLLERRSRLSSVSLRNASERKWSHKLTAWKMCVLLEISLISKREYDSNMGNMSRQKGCFDQLISLLPSHSSLPLMLIWAKSTF